MSTRLAESTANPHGCRARGPLSRLDFRPIPLHSVVHRTPQTRMAVGPGALRANRAKTGRKVPVRPLRVTRNRTQPSTLSHFITLLLALCYVLSLPPPPGSPRAAPPPGRRGAARRAPPHHRARVGCSRIGSAGPHGPNPGFRWFPCHQEKATHRTGPRTAVSVPVHSRARGRAETGRHGPHSEPGPVPGGNRQEKMVLMVAFSAPRRDSTRRTGGNGGDATPERGFPGRTVSQRLEKPKIACVSSPPYLRTRRRSRPCRGGLG